MAGFYFPNEKNLTKMPERSFLAMKDALILLREATLHPFFTDVDSIEFYVDKGMLDTDVMGHTTFLKNRIIVAPTVSDILPWAPSGIPNNEGAMNTIIHELTHRYQMTIFGGLLYLICNNPILDRFTIEKWAVENGEAAQTWLEVEYGKMRKNRS